MYCGTDDGLRGHPKWRPRWLPSKILHRKLFGIIKKRQKIFFSEETTQVINNTFDWLQAPSNHHQECQIAILYHIYIDRPTFYVISLKKSGSNCLVAEGLCCKTKMIRYSFTGDF